MYLKYIVDFPLADAAVLNSKSARSLLGRSLNDRDMPEHARLALFSRDELNRPTSTRYVADPQRGTFYSAPAPVAIAGGERRLILTAIGPQGIALLKAHFLTLVEAISRSVSSPWSVRSYSGECMLGPGGRTYICNSMVLEKNTKKLKRILEEHFPEPNSRRVLTIEMLAPYIKQSIINSMMGQALYLDEQLGSSLAGQIPSDDNIDLVIHGGDPFFEKIQPNSPALGIVVRRLEFFMNMDIQGVWFAGQMRSHGGGAIQLIQSKRLREIEESDVPPESFEAHV